MGAIPDKIMTWQMVQPTSFNKETKESTPGKLEKKEIPVPALQPGEVLVEVAGCGVCHTDLGYFYDGVPTVSKPPLTLGHEISGIVVAGDAGLDGQGSDHPGGHALPKVYPLQDRPGQPMPRSEDARQQPRALRRFFQPHPGARASTSARSRTGEHPAFPSGGCGGRGHNALSGRQDGRTCSPATT